jgi:phosphate:Na+ symporter
MSIGSLFQIFAGIGILLYGIIIMGDALQIIAGDKLRKLLASLTKTPLKGLLVGTLVTSILQSSSATTVMVVSFVDAGFMTLLQAIGVILGANIGTTVTAQLLAFKILNVAYVCTVVGAAISILSRKKRNKYIGIGLVGFGLLFIGMEMMQGPMSFIKSHPEVVTLFGDHIFLAFLSGLVVTLFVQSSSATVGLTMAVASQGVIPLETAIAVVLGDNIGTTITAVLASLGANRSAKQAALSHVVIKIIGTIIIFAILPIYSRLILLTSTDIVRQVANAHTIFNIITALVFLPFTSQYASFIKKIIPDDEIVEMAGPRYLNKSILTVAPAAAVDAVRMEMVRLGTMAIEMIEMCEQLILTGNAKLVKKILRREDNVNELTHDIVNYAIKLGQSGLSSDSSLLLNSCVSGVSDIERIGDHATNLVEVYQYMDAEKLEFSQIANFEARTMFGTVISAVTKSVEALRDEDPEKAKEVMILEDEIDRLEIKSDSHRKT